MGDPVSERPACVLCSHWPEADRWALREMIDSMPLRDDEPVCDECQMAFWKNIGFLDLFTAQPTKH